MLQLKVFRNREVLWMSRDVTSRWEHKAPFCASSYSRSYLTESFPASKFNMVKRCVMGGCSNSHLDGVSIHQFPKDPKLAAKWDRFVRLTRKDWTSANANETSVMLYVGIILLNPTTSKDTSNLFGDSRSSWILSVVPSPAGCRRDPVTTVHPQCLVKSGDLERLWNWPVLE